ncbi:MAG: deoxyribodipyrimidine photolyase [Leptospiraceae bacterium]|nr:deoxyribodipyrimidine photolyase [Leptospiraceae bacterium]
MQINRRLAYNHALDYAVARANQLQLPLLIYEGLRTDYPWASDRLHTFILQGMAENRAAMRRRKLNYFGFAEQFAGQGRGLVRRLSRDAALVVSDEFPVFIMPEHNRRVSQWIQVPYYTIDANGILPMRLSAKDSWSAFIFRKLVQRHFWEAWQNPPLADPLAKLKHRGAALDLEQLSADWPTPAEAWQNPASFCKSLPIDHQVRPAMISGERKTALELLDDFINHKLKRYAKERNHPDADAASRLSPWLHFGKISSFEIVQRVFQCQPRDWQPVYSARITGKNRGFFGGYEYVESFLDELITWREIGYHYAFHRPDYDQLSSLPDWALKTLHDHRRDPRPWLYNMAALETAQTHDEIWNTAQRELTATGFMQNYLRMLWGKKILEWSPDPETALQTMIELNNKYALDGRNPNSYSGIFWVLGRFDRAWFERPIYGKLRYMTSDSTRRKLKMDRYLQQYGSSQPQPDLFTNR